MELNTLQPECQQFLGRECDLCEGRGLDGRPDPQWKHVVLFRQQRSLRPLLQPPKATNAELRLPDQKKIENPKPQRQWTVAEQVASVAKAAAHVAVNGFNPLSEEQIAARLAVCATCEFFQNQKCKLCGCGCSAKTSLTNKLAHPNEQCPHDPPKWGPVT